MPKPITVCAADAPSYNWMGDRAPYGVLLDEPIPDGDPNVVIYAVSGQLVGMRWESVAFFGFEWDGWILEFCFGIDYGAPIIGSFFFGGDSVMVPLYEIYQVWLWFDPEASEQAKEMRASGGSISATDFVKKMELGRLYPMFLMTEIGSNYLQEDQHLIDYNRELFAIMNGSGSELPEDDYGIVTEIFLISTYGHED